MPYDINNDRQFQFEEVGIDPKTEHQFVDIRHNLHPEETVRVEIVELEGTEDGQVELRFTGPDCWMEDEAQTVLQEILDAITAILPQTSQGDNND